MSKEIRADYNIRFLLPPAVEDWIAGDHPARFIRELVDVLDLDELGFRARVSEDGRPSYASDLLLKVWLYGYMERIRSTRGLEKACREHMSLIWLTGNNAPDHNTIWRFFNDNREPLRHLFKRVVKVAVGSGLVGMALHAVDGTKVKARSSKGKVQSREDVKKILEKLDESVENMMGEVERNEEKESGEYRLPVELADRESLRTKLRESLERMDEIDRDYLQPGEPEARMMTVGGRTEPAYNAQAAVDAESGMIVAESVVSDENDWHQLTPMLDEVEVNLGGTAEETVADAGYYTGEGLSKADERNRSVIVNAKPEIPDYEFHWSRFAYDYETDCVICPIGERLPFNCMDYSEKEPRREYKCRRFRECARRHECSKNKRLGRRIRIGPHHRSLLRNAEKLREENCRRLLSRRKSTVEPAFGVIKEVMGFRRWSVGGLANVRAQWSLICTVFNIKKMIKFRKDGKLVLKTG